MASWSKSSNLEEFDKNFEEDAKIIGMPPVHAMQCSS